MVEIDIYTDGACSGNPGVGGWAALLIYGKHRKEICGAVGEATSNQMEIKAVIEGLKAVRYRCDITIYSDSAYVVNAFSDNWVGKWVRNGWLNDRKKPVANRALWEELIQLVNLHSCQFIKVKGHASNVCNNRCDKLAKDAIKRFKKNEKST